MTARLSRNTWTNRAAGSTRKIRCMWCAWSGVFSTSTVAAGLSLSSGVIASCHKAAMISIRRDSVK
mgnify:CR=1 FL=1